MSLPKHSSGIRISRLGSATDCCYKSLNGYQGILDVNSIDADSVGMARFQRSLACNACKGGIEEPFPFTMAFQPIVDVGAEKVYAYEALVRGSNGESAGSILKQVTEDNRYAFDQSCRVKAISLASKLGIAQMGARLSINFIPGAVYSPAACIQLTLNTAHRYNFPSDRLIFEITEAEKVLDRAHLTAIVQDYRRRGFKVALDDFGSGYSGLNLLADFPADIIKLDMDLTRNLHQRPSALAIVKALVELSSKLGCMLVAEGVETIEEYRALRACGIHLMQGYLLARPAFEALPSFTLPPCATTPLLNHQPVLPVSVQDPLTISKTGQPQTSFHSPGNC